MNRTELVLLVEAAIAVGFTLGVLFTGAALTFTGAVRWHQKRRNRPPVNPDWPV